VKNRTLFFKVSLIGLAVATPLIAGCSRIRAWEERRAYGNYQAAVASGDIVRTKFALAALVRVDEDVPDYWAELGRVEVQLGEYGKAYDAYSRAYELDRSNVQILAALTQLALTSGHVDMANQHARSLALLAPDNPAVTLVRSYMAFQSNDLDNADTLVDKLLADSPTDSNAKVLKAHVLIARGRIDDAIALLEKQRQAVPKDQSALRGLVALYRSRDDWRNVARVQLELHKLDPKNTNVAALLLEALLRTGDLANARRVSGPLLSPAADPQTVEATLLSWAKYAPPGRALPDAPQLAEASTGERRVSFANYYNRIGRPAAAAALLGSPQLPVNPANARLNAVIAQSVALQGRLAEAKQLFDQVLRAEPDQPDALRGRSALAAKTGSTRQAIIDAQRLVSSRPDTSEDRLLLARAFLAAGNRKEVARTLWQAFQDMPDDERIVAALRSVLVSTGDLDGERRLTDEFEDKRKAKLTKELV
jgi:tetratricopeptide (TPR) repeat protein